ncbi:hypothetical protein NMY22_g20310 [Coprinellus aureogranulatus]|nr:hypothetical protein NMY22_g20310 [Coprinellus aureogranulatus]
MPKPPPLLRPPQPPDLPDHKMGGTRDPLRAYSRLAYYQTNCFAVHATIPDPGIASYQPANHVELTIG